MSTATETLARANATIYCDDGSGPYDYESAWGTTVAMVRASLDDAMGRCDHHRRPVAFIIITSWAVGSDTKLTHRVERDGLNDYLSQWGD